MKLYGLGAEIRLYETGITSNRWPVSNGENINYFVLTTHQ